MEKLQLGEKEVKYGNVYDHNCVTNTLCVRKMLEGNTWKGKPMICSLSRLFPNCCTFVSE